MRCAVFAIAMAAASVLSLTNAATVGNWQFGGKVSAVQIDSKTVGLETALSAEYSLLTILSWLTDLEVLMRDLTDASKIDISVPTNLLYYPLGHQVFIDPYGGPGLTYAHGYTGSNNLGFNVLVGTKFLLVKDTPFGIEGKLTFPLLPHAGRTTWQVGLTGAWELKI